MFRLTGGPVNRRRPLSVALVLVLVLVLVLPGRCRPQTSSAGRPGGYRSTLLQYLSGIQQELPPARRLSGQQQQQLVDFLQTQQQQQQSQQSFARPQQQSFSRPQQQQQQLSRPQSPPFGRQQQQQRTVGSGSLGRTVPGTAARPSPSGFRRRLGGAIIFPGPAS